MMKYVLASDILDDVSKLTTIPLELLAERMYAEVSLRYKMVGYKTLNEIDDDEDDPFDALDYLIPENDIKLIATVLLMPDLN